MDASARRVLLGSWATPRGNSCDVFLIGEEPLRHVSIEWDRYPLPTEDERHYTAEILPAITRRAQEFLELPGRAIVVRAR